MQIPTTPYTDQKPGTSGLRKPVTVFSQANYLENFVQAVFDTAPCIAGGTIVIGGDGRHHNNVALQTILRMAAAKNVSKVLVGQNGLLSTPALSHLVRTTNAKLGLNLTASHNPGGADGDFGIKVNIESGGPAAKDLTDAIYECSKRLESYETTETAHVDLSALRETQLGSMQVIIVDPVTAYADYMESLFDFRAIREWIATHDICFDAMHAVAGPYAKEVFGNRLNVRSDRLLHTIPLPDFGGGPPDPNPVYARSLFDLMFSDAAPDFGAATDGDGDRAIILGRKIYVGPSDSLAVLAANAHLVPGYANGIVGIARSMPTSRAADAVAVRLGIPCFETPTGWKYFGNLLDAGRITICGEEAAGASSDHLREKDGLWAILMWLNILAVRRTSVTALLRDHWKTYGRHYYRRHDYENVAIDRAQAVMAALRSQLRALSGQKLHGETIATADDFTYLDPVDGRVTARQGLRVTFVSGARFVLRISGTGTRGATLRLYLERYVGSDGRHDMDVDAYLAPIERIADSLTGLHKIINRETPTIVA